MDNDKKITITRIFDAPREMVWKAWTTPELVQQWWGPEGFSAPSIKIDLQVGGKYIYAMQGPAGSQWDKVMYSAGVFKEIIPMEKISTTDFFSDENGNKLTPAEMGMDANFPAEMQIEITFVDAEEGKTKLSIVYPSPANEAQFEIMKKSGMEEGWSTSLDKMAKIL